MDSFIKRPLKDIVRLTKHQFPALKKLKIETVGDLLYHFPVRYGNSFSAMYINEAEADGAATFYGQIDKLETGSSYKTKMPMVSAILHDDSGKIKLTWFNQIYIGKMFKDGDMVRVTGVVKEQSGKLSLLNPTIEKTKEAPLVTGTNLFGESKEVLFMPIYRESKGLTSNFIYHAVKKIITHPDFNTIQDPLPENIRTQYKLPSFQSAMIWIHMPKKESDADAAKKRFSFEEIFYIQLGNASRKKEASLASAYAFSNLDNALEEFRSHLAFDLTEAQERAIESILADFKKTHPMSRLLEGDVGSGKTAVAAAASYAIVSSRIKSMRDGDQAHARLQVAYMAPTEILAKQHYESFTQLFSKLPITIGLLTGSGCKKFPSKSALVTNKFGTDISKSQFLKWVAAGDISIVIGTHALIQKSVVFKDLAFVIIDEQHRFGTKQRQKLAQKHIIPDDVKKLHAKKDTLRVTKKIAYIDNKKQNNLPQVIQTPHLLSMTATPIPRTLALTIYGDLDLSVVDQMPTGRKPIITELVPENKRVEMYAFINEQLKAGRQAYVICARIADPDPDLMSKLILKSVQEEAIRLSKNEFKNWKVGILHSKMKPVEKDKIMKDFLDHKVDVLVATSVVEVGVNVPNSTLIVIEGADRFGLSQLHQLRGRVIRGNHQAYCYLCTQTASTKSIERLTALKNAKNGFELAELDLKMRGAGELYGDVQWGLSDIGMEAIKNLRMVEAARSAATKLVDENKVEPHMSERLREGDVLHME
ncbi:MAG: ATP-dependent DNA helicase RecG [Patescibacteria group bacterium]